MHIYEVKFLNSLMMEAENNRLHKKVLNLKTDGIKIEVDNPIKEVGVFNFMVQTIMD